MTALDLARRLVAAPQWEWRVGMLPAGFLPHKRIIHNGRHKHFEGLPDLPDPATAGILLALLAEPDEVDVQVYSYPGGYTQGWRVVTHTYAGDQLGGYLEREYEAPSLGEAVAKALLEVWGE